MSGISGLSLIGSMVLSTAKIAQPQQVDAVKADTASEDAPANAAEAAETPDNGAVLTAEHNLNLEV